MSLDPELFRHMTPSQIALTLTIDSALERDRQARVLGARCAECNDAGMARSGVMCACEAGRKLSSQAFARAQPPTTPIPTGDAP